MELLNQISEELHDSKNNSLQNQAYSQEQKKKFLLPPRPPIARDIKPIIKEYGTASPASSIQTTKPLMARQQTLPEIQTAKKVTTKTNLNKNPELTLSAGQLQKSTMIKKPAPMVPPPQAPKPPPQSTHTPFAVELGKAGRKPGYARRPYNDSYENIPSNYDLNVVDLEDDNGMMDDISQFSSDEYSNFTQDQKDKK